MPRPQRRCDDHARRRRACPLDCPNRRHRWSVTSVPQFGLQGKATHALQELDPPLTPHVQQCPRDICQHHPGLWRLHLDRVHPIDYNDSQRCDLCAQGIGQGTDRVIRAAASNGSVNLTRDEGLWLCRHCLAMRNGVYQYFLQWHHRIHKAKGSGSDSDSDSDSDSEERTRKRPRISQEKEETQPTSLPNDACWNDADLETCRRRLCRARCGNVTQAAHRGRRRTRPCGHQAIDIRLHSVPAEQPIEPFHDETLAQPSLEPLPHFNLSSWQQQEQQLPSLFPLLHQQEQEQEQSLSFVHTCSSPPSWWLDNWHDDMAPQPDPEPMDDNRYQPIPSPMPSAVTATTSEEAEVACMLEDMRRQNTQTRLKSLQRFLQQTASLSGQVPPQGTIP